MFTTNIKHLYALGFYLAVVTECSPIPVESGTSAIYREPFPGGSKQLGLFARASFRLSPATGLPDAPGLLAARVAGPVELTFLGFWGVYPNRFGSYTSQLTRVIEEVIPLIDGPIVLAGDFNAPIDSSRRAHEANVQQLNRLGLVSAFTATRGACAETKEPTYYHYRDRGRGFHIDHVFVPKQWSSRLAMTVGSYDDWVGSGRSDHVPIIVDVEPGVVSGRLPT